MRKRFVFSICFVRSRSSASLVWSVLSVLALGLPMAAHAQDVLAPPPALVLDGVPAVPAGLAADVGRYTEYKPTGFSSWHPQRLEMLVSRRFNNTAQIYRLAAPGAEIELLTDYTEPVRNASYQPATGGYFLFRKDSGGNEVFRLYRNDTGGAPSTAKAAAISPEDRRMQALAWSNRGDRVVYTTVPVNRKGSDDKVQSEVHISNPLKPEMDKVIAELPGGGWFGFEWSPDDKRLVFLEYVSANESYLWTMDIATGKSRRLIENSSAEPALYGETKFSRDGKGLYTVTDRGTEFHTLNYVDLATLKHTPLSAGIPWDVEDFDLSHDGKRIAFVTNEDGTGVLHIMRARDRKILPAPKLPLGTLTRVNWHRDSVNLAFSVTSAKSPSDVYSLNAVTGKLTRWTRHEPAGADPAAFVDPELVRWNSFDGRSISGFLYHAPPGRFPGKRPVLVNIHGGPEGQFKPGFLGRLNYHINEQGIDVLFPNVRGSSGYGKNFLKLDNGRLREDSVKDIAALFDWIAAQPDLDASRIMVTGGSYGGYMSLAVATLYADRIAASIDVVGISNFVTFLERTESYRRDLRRAEYGDERDPEMRKFLESIAPLNRAERISKPIFVVQGKNDPRVPYTEAEQIVATLKKRGTPVWYMLADDEGHGFAKKANADYQFFSTIGFINRHLLGVN
jgi:dipeptidyl aminopeptidase/acylaminoacyl peptidase